MSRRAASTAGCDRAPAPARGARRPAASTRAPRRAASAAACSRCDPRRGSRASRPSAHRRRRRRSCKRGWPSARTMHRVADDVGVERDVAADEIVEADVALGSGTRKRIAGALAGGDARLASPASRRRQRAGVRARADPRPAPPAAPPRAVAANRSSDTRGPRASSSSRVRRVDMRGARTAGTARAARRRRGPRPSRGRASAGRRMIAGLGLARRALDVGVLDAQDERAAALPRASSQLKSAVRALPTWRCPVGLGAKRTRINSDLTAQLSVSQRRARTACAAMASPRPTRVDAFVGLALDADAVRRRRRAPPASVARMASMCGAASAARAIDASRPRCRPRIRGSARQRHRLDAAARGSSASFQPGSVSGKCRPMSPSAAAPSTASVTAWQTTSASECPSAPAVGRNRDAAEDQRTPGHEPVQVVADASAAGSRRPAPARAARAAVEIVGGRDLHVRRLTLHDVHRVPGALGQSGLVGRSTWPRSPAASAAASTSRRNACGVCARKIVSARSRWTRPSVRPSTVAPDALDRVGDGERGDRRAVSAAAAIVRLRGRRWRTAARHRGPASLCSPDRRPRTRWPPSPGGAGRRPPPAPAVATDA